MKGLFVVFHGFSAHSGISKKIFAQCDALRRNGADIELCHIEIAPDGTQRRMVGGQAIRTPSFLTLRSQWISTGLALWSWRM